MDEFRGRKLQQQTPQLDVAVRIKACVNDTQVERAARIIIGPTPMEPVQVRLIEVDEAASEPPAVIKALAEWIAEGVTTLPFEQVKEGLPTPADTWHLTAKADFIAHANDTVHDLVGGLVGDVADGGGMSPAEAAVVGGVAEHWELPQDSLVDDTVMSLRLVGLTLDLAAGGLPVSECLDLLHDAVNKDIADSISAALTPPGPREEIGPQAQRPADQTAYDNPRAVATGKDLEAVTSLDRRSSPDDATRHDRAAPRQRRTPQSGGLPRRGDRNQRRSHGPTADSDFSDPASSSHRSKPMPEGISNRQDQPADPKTTDRPARRNRGPGHRSKGGPG